MTRAAPRLQTTVRLKPKLLADLAAAAERHGISRSRLIENTLNDLVTIERRETKRQRKKPTSEGVFE